MSLGSTRLGCIRLGTTESPVTTNVTPVVGSTPTSVLQADTPSDLRIGSPVLQLFEIETADGDITRVVDFGHLEASATPGQVTFDGDEYTTIHIQRSSIEEATDGSSPQISISVLDFDHTILNWVVDNDGLRGAKVTLHIIEYDDLDTPALATTRTFRVNNVTSLEGPARIEVMLSSPAFRDYKFPSVPYNRTRCFNAYHRRFVHDGYNYCSFYSDAFETNTRQRMKASADTESEKEFGWYIINGSTGVTYSETGLPWDATTTKKHFHLHHNYVADTRWDDTYRLGPYCYKILPEAYTTDIDIATRMSSDGDLSESIMYGLLIQSRTDLTSWVFWGIRHNSGTAELFERVTDGGTSYDNNISSSDNVVRICRNANDPDYWDLYSMSETYNAHTTWDDTTTWTSRGTTAQATDISGDVNVGLVIATWQLSTGAIPQAYFWYYRALGGGYPSCDRSSQACELRNNTRQFNGFLGLPDGIVSW